MSDGFENMEDAFKRMSEEINFSYDKSLWANVSSELDAAALDTAFVEAAKNSSVDMSSINFSEIDDAYIDESFKNAAEDDQTIYNSDYWNKYNTDKTTIEMDLSYFEASKASKAEYLPKYWSVANDALISEGLNHEYKSAYWEEALTMLEKSDKKGFFVKWSALAALLLLISGFGMYNGYDRIGLVNGMNPKLVSNINTSSPRVSGINGHQDFFEMSNKQVLREGNNFVSGQVNINAVKTEADSKRIKQNENFLENINVTAVNNGSNTNNNVFQSNKVGAKITDELVEKEDKNQRSLPSNTPGHKKTGNKLYGDDLSETSSLKIELTSMEYLPNTAVKTDLSNKWRSPRIEIVKPKIIASRFITLNVMSGLGTLYGQGINTPSLRNTIGISYATSYGKFKKYEIGAGLAFTRNKQASLDLNKKVTRYTVHGSSSRSWLKYNIRETFFSSLDLSFSYNLNRRHKVGAFLSGSYLSALKSDMDYQMTSDDEVISVKDNWGTREGINKWDALVGLTYQYKVSNRISLSLTTQIGMLDRSNNAFLEQEQFDRELNAQIGFHYNIFTKY